MQQISEFDKFSDIDEGRRRDEYFNPAPEACDYCGKPLDDEKYFVDGKERDSVQWGCMCTDCCASRGEGVAYGKGQLYLNQKNGRWLLVGGFPDETEL
ncbi:hypothetical protein [Janthinobacterium sp. SUN120]|uniref:hypothetical protein n=1 Tax=Janthinobacterium sp. SUN120 TaxID=3004099 RepID=UPI0025B240F6|nr:hypothetical protein [Janthinobacterium sp. SUN120]MDN2713706.1 hypothetical protein [Janthinobacterium sp. SUN120]